MKRLQKFLSLLLALATVCTMVPLWAAAEEDTAETEALKITEEENTGDAAPDAVGTALPTVPEAQMLPPYINPLYEDILDESDLNPHVPRGTPDASIQAEYVSKADAVAQAREYLVNRVENFTLYVARSTDSMIYDIMEEAMAHTGNSKEGDSLMWQFAGWITSYKWSSSGSFRNYTFEVTVTYYTTAEQEAELDTAVSNLLGQLNLGSKSDYEKVCAVYDYICANVAYDYDHLSDTNYYLQFTPYAALVNKTAVCQGYALLFYRLMLELGVNVRVITGIAGDDTSGYGGHAWNIVELDGLWYNLDATWDAGYDEYWWFLCCTENFPGHYRLMDYETLAFHNEYPISATDYAPGVTAEPELYIYGGYCGDEAIWLLDRYGNLFITGSGAMYDYGTTDEDNPDWIYGWVNEITSVTVEEGITYLGANAFRGMKKVTSVTLPDGLEEIGDYAFADCTVLPACSLPSSLTGIGVGAFSNCEALAEDIVIPEGVTEIGDYTFQNCYNIPSISLHDGITRIGNHAFDSCFLLNYSSLPDELTAIGDWAFSGTQLSCSELPAKLETIGDYAFNSTYLTGLELPDSLTSIGNYAFTCCMSITEIALPEGLSYLGEGAFSYCYSLTSVVLPESITEIPNATFAHCYALTDIDLPNGLTGISSQAFWFCNSLTDIALPDSLTTIGYSAFESCSVLQSITVPGSVTSIDHYAFQYCSELATVIFSGDAPAIASTAFNGITVTAYYPPGNDTWTEDLLQNYGGSITWICDTHVHNYESTVTAPTCTKDGYTTNTCTLCGEVTVTDRVDALGHTSGEVQVENETAASCTAKGSHDNVVYCTVCGEEVSRETVTVDELPHTPGEEQTENVVTASCSAPGGYDKVTYCTVCGNELTRESVTINAIPHTPGEVQVENEIAATCTSKGSYDNVTYCTVCGTELTREAVTTDELPHSYSDLVTDPTCEEQGYTTHTCTVCGDSYADSYVDALGHDYTYSLTTAPTAYQSGTLTGTCGRCAGTCEVELPKLSEEDYICEVTLEPTETEEGAAVYTWKVTDYGTVTIEVVLKSLSSVLLGDVNGDEKVDTVDAYFIVAYYNKVMELTEDQLAVADVNSDGRVDTVDAYYIVALYNKVIDTLPGDTAHTHSYTAEITEPTDTEEGYTTYTCDCGDSYVGAYTIDTAALEAYGRSYAASLGFTIDYSLGKSNSGYYSPLNYYIANTEAGYAHVAGKITATYNNLVAVCGGKEEFEAGKARGNCLVECCGMNEQGYYEILVWFFYG